MKKSQIVIKRFIKGGLSGAVGAMLPMLVTVPKSTLSDVKTWIAALAVSAVVGGITGLILALDKYLSYTDLPPAE